MHNYRLQNLTTERVSGDVINSIDSMSTNPIPAIYQSGYLTITGYDERFKKYLLGFPNKEVEEGFINFLLPLYSSAGTDSPFIVDEFVHDVETGKPEQFMQRMKAFFADTSLQIEEKDAEKMKLEYGSAFTDNNDIDNSKKYPIDNDRNVDCRKFIDIVEARTQEIVENVYSQIPSEYIDKLLGGIILTGGGSNMKNIEVAFRNITHMDKIRIAKFVHQTINSNSPSITAQDGTMNTVLAILAKGDMNCAGDELSNDLFNNNVDTRSNATVLPSDTPKTPRTPGTGVVMTEAEKKAKEEEEARKKKEAEEEKRRKEEEARLEKERRENSPAHKMFRGIKNFLKKVTEEEE